MNMEKYYIQCFLSDTLMFLEKFIKACGYHSATTQACIISEGSGVVLQLYASLLVFNIHGMIQTNDRLLT